MVLAASVGCKSKVAKDQGPRSGSAGTGSAVAAPKTVTAPTGAAPKLEWKDADGELLLATSDGKTLTGPCGLTGSLTPTEVELAGKKEPWNVIVRDGRTFSFPTLDWVIEVAPNGEVTHKRGGGTTPLGTVTGADNDEALTWFAAFIVAAPMVQHELALQIGATKLSLGGAADLRSWSISTDATLVASQQREDPAPLLGAADKTAWDPTKVRVTPDAAQGSDKIYVVTVKRDDAAMKKAFPADRFIAREKADGTLTLEVDASSHDRDKQIALGKLVGRVACTAHDRGVAALVWTALTFARAHAAVFGGPTKAASE